MKNLYNLTEAKARLSELINRLILNKENIMITKRGKRVAVFMPFEAYQNLRKNQNQGLILAREALGDLDEEIEKMCNLIYSERQRERTREVPL